MAQASPGFLVPVAELPNKTKTYIIRGQSFDVDKEYQLKKLIGYGAYGIVCSAVETQTNRSVAIKKITNIFSDLREGSRVLREMELMTRLNHPNIIKLHQFFRPTSRETFNDIYFVMDLYDTDLSRIIESRQKLTNEHHQYFTVQAFRGLHYLHEAKVMHRDLKPSNLLINRDCALAICDLGMARDDFESAERDLTQYVVTRWYRPPEVLGMGLQSYSNAVDIWSLGLIFAELLVGKVLLPGKDYISQLVMIVDLVGMPHEEEMQFLSEEAKRFLSLRNFEPTQSFSERFPMATPEALDLLSHLLVFHPEKRWSTQEVLAHPYFEKYRNTPPQLEDPPEPFASKYQVKSIEDLRDALWSIIEINSSSA